MVTRAPSTQSTWLGAGALVVAAHGGVLAAVLLAGMRLPVTPPEEPVVLIELPPLAVPAPQVQQAQSVPQPVPQPVQPQSSAPLVEAPPVSAPLPREVVAAQPPQPQPIRNPAPQQSSAPPQAAPQSTSDAPSSDPLAAQQETDYRSLVRGYVARNRFSPPKSRRAGLSGDIGVSFIVNRSGDITNVSVARSSGHALLDGEAVEFIRRLTSVPAFPRDLRRSQILLTITLRFALERR